LREKIEKYRKSLKRKRSTFEIEILFFLKGVFGVEKVTADFEKMASVFPVLTFRNAISKNIKSHFLFFIEERNRGIIQRR